MTVSEKIQAISKNDYWETPLKEFEYHCALLGVFPKLDVCTSLTNTKCEKFIEEKEDALSQEWNVDFFCNPPYSQIEQWMHKAFYQSRKYNVNGLLLVNANTSTKWWKRYVTETKPQVHFVDHRIKFEIDGKPDRNGSMMDSAFVVYRKDQEPSR